ncbi:MAG: kelch repeat-containing protein [bacterium]
MPDCVAAVSDLLSPIRSRRFRWRHFAAAVFLLLAVPTFVCADAPFRGATETDGRWAKILVSPNARWGHSIVYDYEGDRAILFGGYSGVAWNDTWVMSLDSAPQWSRLEVLGTPPPPRYRHTAIFDDVRRRMVVFGGTDGAPKNDVWELSLDGPAEWRQISTSGLPPAPRYAASAIYDAYSDRMVLVSGTASDNFSDFNDLWTLSMDEPATWVRQVVWATPLARWGHTAVYDPINFRMIIFGGRTLGGNVAETWILSLAGPLEWQVFYPITRPSARRDHVAIYDMLNRKMLVFGGYGAAPLGDLWSLDMTGALAWSQPVATGSSPTPRQSACGVYDLMDERMVVYGGWDGANNLDDTYELALDGAAVWTRKEPRLCNQSLVFDADRDRLIAFGGTDGATLKNDVWILDLSAEYPAWTRLFPAGTPPSPRQSHTAVLDPARQQMIVFGGKAATHLNDAYALRLEPEPAWIPLSPAGSLPSPRSVHSAIYDPVGNRMIVHGGWDGTIRADTWTLALVGESVWSELVPSGGSPPAWYGHGALYDPVAERMVITCGQDAFGRHNFTWALSLAEHLVWSEVDGTFPRPTYRDLSTATYDPLRGRMILFGGLDDGGARNDTWSLSLSGEAVWKALAPARIPPSPRSGHSAAYDGARDRLIIFGGPGSTASDTWALEFDPTTGLPGVEPATPRALMVGAAIPNPFVTKTRVKLSLPESARVSSCVYDVSGRVVRTLAEGIAPSGESEISWDGRDDRGRPVSRGLYLLQVRSGTASSVRRVVRY